MGRTGSIRANQPEPCSIIGEAEIEIASGLTLTTERSLISAMISQCLSGE
jgi:hypothetical protein